jgi:hypothetical protein
MSAMSRTLTGCIPLLLFSVGVVGGPTPTHCGTPQVHYQPVSQNLAARIQLSQPATLADVPGSALRVASPQGTRWFFEVDPDYTSTKEPWNTTLYIHVGGQKDRVLRFDAKDQAILSPPAGSMKNSCSSRCGGAASLPAI